MSEESRRSAYEMVARKLESDSDHLRVIRTWVGMASLSSFDALMDRLEELRLAAAEDRRAMVRVLEKMSAEVCASNRRFDSVQRFLITLAVVWVVWDSAQRGPSWLLSLLVAGAVALWVGAGLKRWVEGWRGLGQWPHAHGRYYDEWLAAPPGSGDYYEWLAKRMGNREPWQTWALLERRERRNDVR